MNDADIFTEVDYLWISGIMHTRINIYPMPSFAQLAGKLTDVNIHPAGVFCTQLPHRAGMNTEHRNF